MAATNNPFVWDFYREAPIGVNGLAGVVHYFDEQSQSLYTVTGALATKTAEIQNGQWETSEPEDQIVLTSDNFSTVRLDHPSNGILYGAATDGQNLTFLRYVYARDVSQITESWSWLTQTDNAISQFSGSVRNIGADVFMDDVTLFQPGSRIAVSVRLGDSKPYPIGVAWIDECTYDETSESVDISGRNTIGFYLRDQTFDGATIYSGQRHVILEEIMQHAGVKKYDIQTGTETQPFIFKSTDSLMDGLQVIFDYYTDYTNALTMVELADGTVCIGSDSWIAEKQSNGYYSFDEGKDVFSRKTSKIADGSYTSVRITGFDENGNALEPATASISNFQFWALGAHKTLHVEAPFEMSQEELQTWAEIYALKYQYIGIGEDFTGPFRPQLLVGDVAEVTHGTTATSLGVITEVTHSFGTTDGYKTKFSVDSGGLVTDGDNYIVYSRTASVNGSNRKQRITDFVRLASGK